MSSSPILPTAVIEKDDVVICVKNLTKVYHVYNKPQDRLKQMFMPRLNRLLGRNKTSKYFHEFRVLDDVSFTLRRGETVGVIGRNGAGKSTLLQLITGTLSPTAGEVEVKGRVAAILELGSGFNPEFTGRENIYMNATILGLSTEEIDERFDRIVAFADIGKFIEQPIKAYSSGMMIRLAFAVQTQVDPDILIVDEALAVGDAKFQAKCFDRLRQLKENGTSILLVTHSSEQIVTHCSKAILLDQGIQLETGNPKYVVNRYLDILFGRENDTATDTGGDTSNVVEKSQVENELSITDDVFSKRLGYSPYEYRWGDGKATILDFNMAVDNLRFNSVLLSGQNVSLSVAAKFHSNLYWPIFGVTIKTKEGITVYSANSETLECAQIQELGRGGTVMRVDLGFTCRFGPGDYFISLGIATRNGEEIVPHDRRYDVIHFQVPPNASMSGLLDLELAMYGREVS